MSHQAAEPGKSIAQSMAQLHPKSFPDLLLNPGPASLADRRLRPAMAGII
jgi:hypothetical protein